MTDRVREIAEQVARITSENARLLHSLGETERRFQRISRGVLRLQEEERGRISRDLHDGVGQLLTALKIQLELLEQEAAREGQPELVARAAAARELADKCLAEVRQLAHLIRPQMLDELGLAPTLRWLARTVQKRSGIVVEFVHEAEGRLEPGLETLVFRLVQEALNNVVKHARVDRAAVSVTVDERELQVTVEDGGVGFDAEQILSGVDEDRGFGVRAMRDRVRFFNGRFDLLSAPGRGTRIQVAVPLSPERRP